VPARKPTIGLCGGIGAGKSQVAAEFARQSCIVIDSDQLNHEVLRTAEVAQTLRQWWGAAILTASGEPDRQALARIVFAHPAEKDRLEQLVYPLIAARREAIIKAAKENSAITAIVIDSPLLFESNLDRECDTVIFVAASAAQRLERLQATRGWDAAELRRRERWQLSTAEKRRRAEFVIHNDGPVTQLGPQVAGILRAVLARCSSPD
jgi:dephospho-CoA kinase